MKRNDQPTQQPTPIADEYARLQHAAVSLLDTADQAARNGDTTREARAVAAAERLHHAANHIGTQRGGV